MKRATILIILSVLLSSKIYSKLNEYPNTFLLNNRVLNLNKKKLERDSSGIRDVYSKVITLADEAMGRGPYSVTFKKETPPSGDKRDYMSVGPYWWPDSTRPDGLPYIRKDGVVNPERFAIKDVEYFKAVCNDVLLLSVAKYFSEDIRYGKKASEILNIWFIDEETRMNPNLKYGQSIPGITEGRGIGLIDTRSLVYLIDAIQLLKFSGDLSSEDYFIIQTWFEEFLKWMLESDIGIEESNHHNNHGTYYDVQAISIALFVDKKDVALDILNNKTQKRIESQFTEDGSQPHELSRTLSWNYSVMNLNGFFELALLSENINIDLWNYVSPKGKSIKKAYQWLVEKTANDSWEYQQIRPINKYNLSKLSIIASSKYNIEPIYNEFENRDYLFELIFKEIID